MTTAVVKVPLSTGEEAVVRVLRYKPYRELKTKVLKMLTEDQQLIELIQQWTDSENLSLDAKILPVLIGKIAAAIEELNDQFVRGCLSKSEELDFDDLTLEDITNLSEAAQQTTPIETIVEREKNSPAGSLIRQLMELVDSSDQTPPENDQPEAENTLNGGLELNPPLYDPAGIAAT